MKRPRTAILAKPSQPGVFADRTENPGKFVAPDCHESIALLRLLHGYCPYCWHAIQSIVQTKEGRLTWACLDGCNP
jgi:hypothetical protein